MLLNELIESNNQLLLEGDFSAYIKHLYKLGVLLEKDFVQDVKNNAVGTFAEESDKKKRFYKYIAYRFTIKSLYFPSEQQNLYTRLWNLQSFLMAWEDPELRKEEDKKIRLAIKFKGEIDKYFRRRIHAALIAEVVRMQSEVDIIIKKGLSTINCESNVELINCLATCISLLKNETPDDDEIKKTYDNAAIKPFHHLNR
jgi:hypothetical protein